MTDPVMPPVELPADLAQQHNPYSFLNRVRETAPVVPIRWRDGFDAWMVTRYDLCRAALSNPALSHDQLHEGSDAPEHNRLRALVQPAFTTRAVRGHTEMIRQHADRLLGGLDGPVDLIEVLEGLTYAVIGDLIGVPSADRHLLRSWAHAEFGLVKDAPSAQAVYQAYQCFADYLCDLIAERRQHPDGTLLGAIATRSPESYPDLQVAAELFAAGGYTTVALLGNGLLAQLCNPDQMTQLREDPGLLPAAFDEFLRFDGVLLERHVLTTAEVDIAGTRIPAGSVLLLCLGSANRDPRHFPSPDKLLVTRNPNDHLGLGWGIHFCLGTHLARQISTTIFRTLLSRYSTIDLTTPPTDLRRTPSTLRRLDALPVLLHRP